MARRPLILAAAALMLGVSPLGFGLSQPALAIDVPARPDVWQGADGTSPAVSGYDPVAYFSGIATPGSPTISVTHEGARYQFSSIENRDAFLASPAKYLPIFGGHCGWAASEGRKAGGNPKIFRIDDGKLLLNCSPEAESKWLAGLPGTQERATAWWAAQPH